jgi:hypothetical protein
LGEEPVRALPGEARIEWIGTITPRPWWFPYLERNRLERDRI